MNLIEQLQQSFTAFVKQTYNLPESSKATLTINTDEQKKQFGDLNSNIALALAGPLKKKPLEIARAITEQFTDPVVEKIEVAGAGFLNFYLTNSAFNTIAHTMLEQKAQFFKPSAPFKVKKISLEFVSANPTGPLHLGHGRNGIIGDVLGNILRFLGHEVTKEFYINDAGAQIAKLGISFKIRCLQAAGQHAEIPEDGYHGEYLTELAQQCTQSYGKELFKQPDHFFADYAKEHMLKQLQHTLANYGIFFDVWFSEKSLHDSGQIELAIDQLQKNGTVYEQDRALWFASTKFGDDKDRVVRKASGELTYIAADFAYLKNKIDRGFDELIMVLGHDHHSFAVRLQAALEALAMAQHPLFVILYQLVSIKQSGQQVRMSKRSGTMVTLDEIIHLVGRDVARYFYLNRKADAQLEFDLDLALTKTDENPVYYVQYAYVRTKSILQKAALIEQLTSRTHLTSHHLFTADERFLLNKIMQLKTLLVDISHNHQGHQLAYYTHELAQVFNRYYHTHHVVDTEDITCSLHRLALVSITRQTLETAFDLLGISKPEKM